MDVSVTWLRVVGPFPVSPRESRGGGFPPRRQSRPPPPVRGLAPLRIPPTASTSSHAGRGVEEAPAGGSPGLNEGYPIRCAEKPIRWKHARQNAHTARRGRPQNRPVPTAPTRRGATEHRQQHRQPEATPTSRKKLMATREPKPKTEAPQATARTAGSGNNRATQTPPDVATAHPPRYCLPGPRCSVPQHWSPPHPHG